MYSNGGKNRKLNCDRLIAGLKHGAYIESGDSASGIARDKFDMHFELTEQILTFGTEARARAVIQGQLDHITSIEYLSKAFAENDFNILVEVIIS